MSFIERMRLVRTLHTRIPFALDFFHRSGQIGINGDKDLAAVRAASLVLIIHIRAGKSSRKTGSDQVQYNRHAAALPVTGGQNPAAFFYASRIAGKIAFLIESARIGELFARKPVDAEFPVCVLAHGHIQDDLAVLSRDSHAEGIIADTLFIASPQGHAAFRIDPADSDKAFLSHLPGICPAAHPVGRIAQGYKTDPMFLRKLHCAVRAEQGVRDAGACMAVIILDSAL